MEKSRANSIQSIYSKKKMQYIKIKFKISSSRVLSSDKSDMEWTWLLKTKDPESLAKSELEVEIGHQIETGRNIV